MCSQLEFNSEDISRKHIIKSNKTKQKQTPENSISIHIFRKVIVVQILDLVRIPGYAVSIILLNSCMLKYSNRSGEEESLLDNRR